MSVNMLSNAVSKHSQIYTNTKNRGKRKKKYNYDEDRSLNVVIFVKEHFFSNCGSIKTILHR